MQKSTAEIWRDVFHNWPPQFRRKGVLLPCYGEATAFCDFVMTDDVVVLERSAPDGVGARRIAIPFGLIEGLKYTEPLKTEQFLKSGYRKGKTVQAPKKRKPTPMRPKPGQTPPAAAEASSTPKAANPAAPGPAAAPAAPAAAPTPPVSAPPPAVGPAVPVPGEAIPLPFQPGAEPSMAVPGLSPEELATRVQPLVPAKD